MGRTGWCVALSAALIVSACGGDADPSSTTVDTNDVVIDGLDHPTQFTDGPDGLLVIAELAGDEEAHTGRIVAVDLATDARRVIVSGLDKPTGVLWADGVLWVMQRRGLARAKWAHAEDEVGPLDDVLTDLPFNGRSEGTLTELPDGRILYETTGTLIGDDPAPGSGTLWALDPTDETSTPIATGLKNAYAHTVLPDGRLVTTDIGDNISKAPVEEVNVIMPTGPTDLGWPRCPGDQACAGVVGPLSLFPVSATPTGVTVIGANAYVTLFVTGQLMRVPIDDWAIGDAPVEPVAIASGLHGPHTVQARADGTLWISEHEAGRIIAVHP